MTWFRAFYFCKQMLQKGNYFKQLYFIYTTREMKEDTMADLSGKFDYSALRRELKDGGVKNMYMNSALRKVAADNDIDNIKSIDGSEEIKIAQSIFNNALLAQGINSSVDMANNEALLPYTNQDIEGIAAGKIMGDGDNVMDLPEIYNDEDYEVVDYDDFYGFPTEETSEESETKDSNDKNNKQEDELDFDAFKDKYANSFQTGTIANEAAQNEALKKIFGMLDVDSSDTLSKTELSGAYYSSMFNQERNLNDINSMPQEGQDPLGGDMMNMDMQNDSFNPQG